MTQARVDREREERNRETRTQERRHSPEVNDEDLCDLPCFTRRVRKTRVPSSFKLPYNYKKFDRLQDPEDWLVDYLEIVKLMAEPGQLPCRAFRSTSAEPQDPG